MSTGSWALTSFMGRAGAHWVVGPAGATEGSGSRVVLEPQSALGHGSCWSRGANCVVGGAIL